MFEGFDTLAEHAEKLDKSTRTLQRWISLPDGLPHTRRGRELLFKEEWTRDWLERGKMQRNPLPAKRQPRPRARGRRASLSCATA